jgi:hypothetical protein
VDRYDNRQKAGITVFTLLTVFPGLLLAGFLGPVAGLREVMGPRAWLALAAAGGAVGGGLFSKQHPVVGAVSGLIAGPCSLLLTSWYASMRTSVFALELVLVAMVGAAPGLILHQLAVRFLPRRRPGVAR